MDSLADALFDAYFRWHRGDTLNLHSATYLTQIVRHGERARAGGQARAAIAESETQRLNPFNKESKP